MIFAALNFEFMKKILILAFVCLGIIACEEGVSENTMVVSGNVKGLKKGKLYLQKLQDSVLIAVDSLEIAGDGNFSLRTEIESPEIYYLYLDKKDNTDFNDRVTFFGTAGTITINTAWNTFQATATIDGSESQKLYEIFQENLSKFNKRSLEYIQASSAPEMQANKVAQDSLLELNSKNTLRAYLYALNFALSNKQSYVAPYIALTEVPDANVKYLDSIHNSLLPEVAESKYGMALKKHITTIKAQQE